MPVVGPRMEMFFKGFTLNSWRSHENMKLKHDAFHHHNAVATQWLSPIGVARMSPCTPVVLATVMLFVVLLAVHLLHAAHAVVLHGVRRNCASASSAFRQLMDHHHSTRMLRRSLLVD